MLREAEFKPTPCEEEILARCVDYDQFREEIGKGWLPQAERRILGKAGLNNGKSAPAKRPAQPSITCPECGSPRIWKDGLRYVKTETAELPIQRYLCRDCGRRFSETMDLKIKLNVSSQGFEQSNPGNNLLQANILSGDLPIQPVVKNPSFKGSEDVASQLSSKQTMVGKHINTFVDYSREHQVCVTELKDAKNLVGVESQLQEAKRGATTLSTAETKGKIVEYSWFMKQEGYKPACIKSYTSSIEKLVRKGANLMDPQQVKRTIGSVDTWCDGTKKCMAEAYNVFTRMEHLTWEKPRFKPRSKLPFIPTMQELDQLITGCGRIMRAYLRGLKETGADPGELFMLEWKDVDFKRKKVSINFPVKNHNPRILKVSAEWLMMLSKLPRKSTRIWTAQYDSHYNNFHQRRRRLAHEYGNPRLQQICFRTFRHWKGTMEYHVTKDILHVKEMLGHKTVKSTEIYIHLEAQLFESLESEYEVRRARSIKGMLALAAVGFQKFDEVDGVHLYKKPRAVDI